jgi:hypothetical protein
VRPHKPRIEIPKQPQVRPPSAKREPNEIVHVKWLHVRQVHASHFGAGAGRNASWLRRHNRAVHSGALPSLRIDAELVKLVTDTARRLISEAKTGAIDGEHVASELGRGADDNDLYWAFKEAQRRGDLVCEYPGGMQLPSYVTLPALN